MGEVWIFCARSRRTPSVRALFGVARATRLTRPTRHGLAYTHTRALEPTGSTRLAAAAPDAASVRAAAAAAPSQASFCDAAPQAADNVTAAHAPPACPAATACGASALPRVASSAPVRLHIVDPPAAGDGGAPPCGCGRQHVELGVTYRYCTCGLSTAQPWCNDACAAAGSPFRPRDFVVQQRQTWLLMCACKRTRDPQGRCDGEHIHIDYAKLDW